MILYKKRNGVLTKRSNSHSIIALLCLKGGATKLFCRATLTTIVFVEI